MTKNRSTRSAAQFEKREILTDWKIFRKTNILGTYLLKSYIILHEIFVKRVRRKRIFFTEKIFR